eukprot:scaffold57493_cov20-Tisochrysis_lutea.AAC.3
MINFIHTENTPRTNHKKGTLCTEKGWHPSSADKKAWAWELIANQPHRSPPNTTSQTGNGVQSKNFRLFQPSPGSSSSVPGNNGGSLWRLTQKKE